MRIVQVFVWRFKIDVQRRHLPAKRVVVVDEAQLVSFENDRCEKGNMWKNVSYQFFGQS